jgi:hypothetical protein
LINYASLLLEAKHFAKDIICSTMGDSHDDSGNHDSGHRMLASSATLHSDECAGVNPLTPEEIAAEKIIL